MKVLIIFLMVFFLAGGLYVTGPDTLFASDDNAPEQELIQDGDQQLEDMEDENKADTDEDMRIMDEEGDDEAAPDDQMNDQMDDQNDDEKEYPDEKLIDDRG